MSIIAIMAVIAIIGSKSDNRNNTDNTDEDGDFEDGDFEDVDFSSEDSYSDDSGDDDEMSNGTGGPVTPDGQNKKKRKRAPESRNIAAFQRRKKTIIEMTIDEITKRTLAVTPRDIESEVSLILNRNRIKSLIFFYSELLDNLENKGDDDNKPWKDSNDQLYNELTKFKSFLIDTDVENSLDYILFMWRTTTIEEDPDEAQRCATEVLTLFDYLKKLSSIKLVITSDNARQIIAKKLGKTLNESQKVSVVIYCEYQKTKIIELMKSFYKFPQIVKQYIETPITIHVLDEIRKIIQLSRFYKQTSKEAQSMRGLTLEDIERRRNISFYSELTNIVVDIDEKNYSEEERMLISMALKRFQDNIGVVIYNLFSPSGRRNIIRDRNRRETDLINAILLGKDLQKQKIKPDGNCLFASILEGTKKLGKGAIFTKDADSDSDIGKIRKVINGWINEKINTFKNTKERN